MPRKRNTERVVVVRTDANGNIIDYDVVSQTSRSNVVTRQPSQRNEQSQRISRSQTYDNEDEDEDEDIPIRNSSSKRTSRNSTSRTVTTPRRVRYVRPKSTVKIFDEKSEWTANPKIDSRNDEAMKKIRQEPLQKIPHQKLSWDAKPKIDSHNEEVIDTINSRPKSQIFREKTVWNADPKIDSHNEVLVDNILRSPKQRIYDKPVILGNIRPKIDNHNEGIVHHRKNTPKSMIYDEKLTWSSSAAIDHQNPEYLQHRQREQALREQQTRARLQSFAQERPVKADRPRIDAYNAEFIEHQKRTKSSKLPPIEDRKLEWEKRSRINQKNDAYIERIRQKRSVPVIFHEKVRWKTKAPLIDHHNEGYRENLKDKKQPKIINRLPQWNPQPKIDSYNNAYNQNSDSYLKPVIVNEKLRWHARPKIDTGLEPDLNDDEYVDDGLTA